MRFFSFRRRVRASLGALALLGVVPVFGAAPGTGRPAAAPPTHAAPNKTAAAGLPAFSGWQIAHKARNTRPGWGLPAAEVPVMREYGLESIERATYELGGRQIQVSGYRFSDLDGAYGAFTFYRPADFFRFNLKQPNALAASRGTAILFTRGRWLIRVQMDKLTAMTQDQMQHLAANLTPSAGQNHQPPVLPYYLPRRNLIENSLHFVLGPAGFTDACTWLAPADVGFNMGAEAVVANYDLGNVMGAHAAAQMVVISYPTPTMARTHLTQLQPHFGLDVRRSGPLLVLVHNGGAATQAQLRSLLKSVNFDADITMVPLPPVGINGLPALVLGIFVLCGLIIAVAVIVGLLTGFLHVMVQRALPERYRRARPESLVLLRLDRQDQLSSTKQDR